MELRWRALRVVFDKRRFVVFLGITGTFTLLGPFGTYDAFDLPMRLLYWTAANAGVALSLSIAGDTLFAPGMLTTMPRAAKTILTCVLGAIGGTGPVCWAEIYLRGGNPNPLYVWFCVFSVCVVVMALRLQMSSPSPNPFAKFFKRLPPELGVDLVCLSMADHYVEVRTTQGSTMILMRFADALAELAEYPGMQTHRSHWVAEAHASKLAREGSRQMLELDDGNRLPVSKAHLPGVRAMLERKHEERLAQIGQPSDAAQSSA